MLLLDGEELVGAKQNRIVNLSILVPANSELVIPVSCVEAGRWHHASADFAAAERAHFASGRAKKVANVRAKALGCSGALSQRKNVWLSDSMRSPGRIASEGNDPAILSGVSPACRGHHRDPPCPRQTR